MMIWIPVREGVMLNQNMMRQMQNRLVKIQEELAQERHRDLLHVVLQHHGERPVRDLLRSAARSHNDLCGGRAARRAGIRAHAALPWAVSRAPWGDLPDRGYRGGRFEDWALARTP